MRILVTGACGFTGSVLAKELLGARPGLRIFGIDNFCRPGSETNRQKLGELGVKLRHGDVRNPSDLESLPPADWIIDAAAQPSVLAGVSGITNSRQLLEHNLLGTLNLLELCKRSGSGFIMLSTSRVYSLPALAKIPLAVRGQAFAPKTGRSIPGLSPRGISEDFSIRPPLSLYGCSKLASENLALEYGEAFGFPVFINRCGVMAGAGQFGKPDQGIFSYWIHSYLRGKPLAYIGFGGRGRQVRDCLHPRDLAPLLLRQMKSGSARLGREPLNVSGGTDHALSLAQLTSWCDERFGLKRRIQSLKRGRPYDVPWLVLDSSRAARVWGWKPNTPMEDILLEIADHAERYPRWLELSAEL